MKAVPRQECCNTSMPTGQVETLVVKISVIALTL